MPRAKSNDIEIEYESFGDPSHETILLIMGLGAQLTQWPVALCNELVTRGYRVIRFDNRDTGLSSRIERGSFFNFPESFASVMAGAPSFVPYTLGDMADDAVGLMDALGIEKAHIVGASMGGMIAQLIAADYPERVLSLTSIMSSSGNPMLPHPKPRVLAQIMSPAPSASNFDAIVARGIKTYRAIGSPKFPTDEGTLRKWVTRDAKRAYYPAGVLRQIAAVMTNGDRRPKLRRIVAPTVVLHGEDDPLVPVEAGRDTAANIDDAELRVVPGMGHDIPLRLVGVFADAIVAAAERATGVKIVAKTEPEPHRLADAWTKAQDMVAHEASAVAEAVHEVAEALPAIVMADALPAVVAAPAPLRPGLVARLGLWFRRFLARFAS
jgi:pimeloyl-ACP methyl ester carboxylesterase